MAGKARKQEQPGGFDAVLGELQTVVDQLEKGETPLEESLAIFERGIALARKGQEILDAAERKVDVLLQDGSTVPLVPKSESENADSSR